MTTAATRRGLHIAFAVATATAIVAGVSAPPAAASQREGSASDSKAVPVAGIVGGERTKALFAKVHRAYLHVRAVEMTVIPAKSTLKFPRTFVLILRSGRVVAEEFTRPGREGVTLVARRFHRTYSRTTGATCWRRLPVANPQTLADVGILFPYTRVTIKALPPRRTPAGWVVASENRAEYWFLALHRQRPAHLLDRNRLPDKRFITYTIDVRSHRLKYLFITEPRHRPQRTWPTATLRVRALATAPRLPSATPVC